MKKLGSLAILLALSGCAGMTTAWVLHVKYLTPKPVITPVPTKLPEGKPL